MTRLLTPRAGGAAVLMLALVVAGCAAATTPAASGTPAGSPSAAAGASAPASAPAGSSAATASAVTIHGFAFGPSSLSVAAGTTVTWTNTDSVEHTVTADDGSFGSQPLPSGGSFSQTFTAAGTYAYHCKIHPSMTATITVH